MVYDNRIPAVGQLLTALSVVSVGRFSKPYFDLTGKDTLITLNVIESIME